MKMEIQSIGIIGTPFKTNKGIPIQPCVSNAAGQVVVDEQYAKGFESLDSFSHIILEYPYTA
jgi:tRNA (Thr-GGU) A37 N-methylase